MSNPLTNGTFKKKVKEIQNKIKEYTGANGTIYYHKIIFDDGSQGTYGSKSETCTKFVIGVEAEFTCEVKVNGQFTNYNIKPVQAGGPGFRGGNGGGGVDMKLYAATESFKLAKQTAEKSPSPLSKEDLVKIAKSYYDVISEIASGKA